jgi:hypothetical protein
LRNISCEVFNVACILSHVPIFTQLSFRDILEKYKLYLAFKGNENYSGSNKNSILSAKYQMLSKSVQ